MRQGKGGAGQSWYNCSKTQTSPFLPHHSRFVTFIPVVARYRVCIPGRKNRKGQRKTGVWQLILVPFVREIIAFLVAMPVKYAYIHWAEHCHMTILGKKNPISDRKIGWRDVGLAFTVSAYPLSLFQWTYVHVYVHIKPLCPFLNISDIYSRYCFAAFFPLLVSLC